MKLLSTLTLTLALAAAFALPLPTLAQSARTSQSDQGAPRITGFDVEQVPQLTPGTELDFTVWGTPGATAALQIDGAARPLALFETSPGVYRGIYTISQRDRIAVDARVSANLRHGNRVGTATLDEWLQTGAERAAAAADAAAAAAAAEPRIEKFEVRHGNARGRDQKLEFRVLGTPGGQASVRMAGAQQRLRLDEVRSGEYTGSYTIRGNDWLDPKDPIVAMLRVGDRRTRATLENALDVNRLGQLPQARACSDCATVTAVNRVEVQGDGRYVAGTVAGGVLGAVVGSQVGSGSGRTAAQVAGALGGALLGREVHKRNQDKVEHYEVMLQMRDSGAVQMVSYEAPPAFKVGDKVLLRDGVLTLQR